MLPLPLLSLVVVVVALSRYEANEVDACCSPKAFE
jgi:hypothetical protein